MENEKNDVMQNTTKEVLLMAIKDKLIECVARNIAKEKCGDPSKKYKFYIEAEELLKTLLLQVLVEKANGGDPLEYVEFLENVEEILYLDDYDVFFIESMVFGE